MKKGIAIGINKGFVTTKIAKKRKVERPASRKGKSNEKVLFVRSLIREVTGLAPYEKRIVELIKAGSSKDTKKALKIAKARLGTHRRAKKKREYLEEYVR